MRSTLKSFVFVFIFIILKVPLFHAFDINCPYSFCGSEPFSITYPFIIAGQKPQVCSHYINLICTSQSNIVLNIPFSGDFYVVSINYYEQSLTLRDPKNCLAERLMKLNLSSSPFAAAKHYRNFTFYNCPIDKLMYDFRVIDCLSIPPNVTVVSSKFSSAEKNKFYGCSKIITKEIPADDEYDVFGNLELTWNVPSCTNCEGFKPQQNDKGSNKKVSDKIALAISILMGIIVVVFLVALYKRIAYDRRRAIARTPTAGEASLTRQTTIAATVEQPQLVNDEDLFAPDGQQSYLKTMRFSTFLEWNLGSLEGHDQGSCCTICLEAYSPQDVVRCLTSCHHYFHSKCIDKWFRGDNSSCPVCRKSVFDV